MGMFDSLGNLGGLGQITKMLDPGNWIKQGLNSVLPQNMHVLGDTAGALFDLQTGNLLGAAQLGMQAVKDLPQATKGAQQQTPQAQNPMLASLQRAAQHLEPLPPPTTAKPMDMNALLNVLKQLTDILSGKQPDSAKTDTAKTDTAKTDTAKTATPDAPSSNSSSKAADAPAKSASAGSCAGGSKTTTTTTTTTTYVAASGLERTNPRSSDGVTYGRRRDAGETSSTWKGTPTTAAPTRG
ncbi:MAG TPA: hypothetical protein VN903_05300, partial [Polyangia bacterium]|nr:hypothetical protein [Polyangia bacterium]